MNIEQIIAQLRTVATIFGNNVAGAAAYANGVQDQSWLPYPAAYVVPADQDAAENTSTNGLNQIVHERFAVIVVLQTAMVDTVIDYADRRGQAAAAYLDVIKYSIFQSILNWRPDFPGPGLRESRGIYFAGAGFPESQGFDRGRFFYQFSFALDTMITDIDGWQQPTTPLVQIQGTIEPPGPLATFEVPFPPPAHPPWSPPIP